MLFPQSENALISAVFEIAFQLKQSFPQVLPCRRSVSHVVTSLNNNDKPLQTKGHLYCILLNQYYNIHFPAFPLTFISFMSFKIIILAITMHRKWLPSFVFKKKYFLTISDTHLENVNVSMCVTINI